MSASSPDVTTSLTERVHRALREAIVRCEFTPGQRLRVEELTRRYEISSSPVREALNRLVEQGFVRVIENRGFRVAPLSVEGIADLTRVRLLVECEALRDAMANGSDRWETEVVAAGHGLALVEHRLGEAPLVLDDDWSQRHREFHLAIYSGASSPLLRELVAALFDSAERYRRYSALHRKVMRRKHTEHRRLQNAVLARDANALELLRQHISATERNVTESLLGMPGPRVQ